MEENINMPIVKNHLERIIYSATRMKRGKFIVVNE